MARHSTCCREISQGRSLRVDILSPAAARLSVGSTRPPTIAENQNDGTAILAIDIIPETNTDVTRVAVLLTPVGEKWPQLRPPELAPLAAWR